MPMTPLTTPPSRSDPANFAERGDVFLASLPGFVTEANALELNVNAKEASAVSSASGAAASAVTANAAANAAGAYANSPQWLSGTAYALNSLVWSPTNRFIYRRIIAGAGVTDPAADAVNWTLLVQPVAAGGSGAQTPAGARANFGAAQYGNADVIAVATGTADVITAAFTPAVPALSNGIVLMFKSSAAAASTAPTFSPNALPPAAIVKGAGAPLAVGDIPAGYWVEIQYDTTLAKWVMLNPATGVGGDVAATSINGQQLAGLRNKIINGGVTVAQRVDINVAPTFVAFNGTGGYGGPDRYFASNQGAGGQFTQSIGTLVYNGVTYPTVRQTVNSPPTNLNGISVWYGVCQIIESRNVFDLLGKPVAVSFIAKATVAGTFSFVLRDGTSSYSLVRTFTLAAATPTKITLPLAALPLALPIGYNDSGRGLFVQIAGLNTGTLSGAANAAWQGPGVNRHCATGATNWAATAGNTFEATQLQLEEGTACTPFETRPYPLEVLLCQRYWYFEPTVIWGGYNITANTIFMPYKFPVPVRTASVSFPSTAYANANGIAISYASSNVVGLAMNVTSTGYGYTQTNLQCDGELY